MIFDEFKEQLPDSDVPETEDWMVSLDEVVERAGPARAQFLLYKVLKRARQLRLGLPPTTQTRYINTISPEQEPDFPGDEALERRIRRLIRWNAVAMVTRANNRVAGLGGHLSTYASAASLYEVGFNHFFRGREAPGGGDLVYFQGHASPGIYARAFLEGRLDEARLDRFRREVGGGLSSYPHPRLMPDFWEFPTVSMGLSPINAIYQARFLRYLHNRGIADTSGRRVWAFLGDGETDEPEALAALTLAAREGLDNLIFVVNCNLQRLDGPVRGNGKIIQELEAVFRGAGWHVFKVIWGRNWDELLRRDVHGALLERMNETVDGQYQRYQVESGAYIRERFFGPDPRLRSIVEHLSDSELKRLRRGGHDYRKVHAAYHAAVETAGAPTVILAKTVKGWTLGDEVEGRNVTHQIKKLSEAELKVFRDRLDLPISDRRIGEAPYYHPGEQSEEVRYMLDRRRALGGSMPRRVVAPVAVDLPGDDAYEEFLAGTEATGQQASTTMAFARLARNLMNDPGFGERVVPIIPDEGRTFGMDPFFSQFQIYSPMGQRYKPVDAEFVLSYKESERGQILEEGITEAGAMASFTAAGTSHATIGQPVLPLYIFYSMFGFQRIGDAIWAFADSRGRGFLLGATAGRTTLNGEGLQHQDGHSLLHAATVPSCRAYDPAFAYEMTVIIQEGTRRMLANGEDIFYYLTLYNEPYVMPAMPRDAQQGILRGLYLLRRGAEGDRPRAQLLGSGPMALEALRAQTLLAEEYGVDADVWSVTSYGELRREALECERRSLQDPLEPAPKPYITSMLEQTEGPIVAASDYIKAVPGLVSPWVPRELTILGTDGYGRSDTREALRRYFEIDAEQMVLAVLARLARAKEIAPELVRQARQRCPLTQDE